MTFDQQHVELTCPTCGRSFQETVGRLKQQSPPVRCPGCQQPIRISAADLAAREPDDEDGPAR